MRLLTVLLLLIPLGAEAARTKVAVLDVRASGKGLDARAVEPLSALIASEVARRGDLDVTSGADLRAMIGFEKQRAALGCEDTSCLAEIGGALGVEFLVASEASRFGGSYLLSLSLIDVKQARSVHRLTRRTKDEAALLDEVPGAVAELVERVPRPAAVATVEPAPVPVPVAATEAAPAPIGEEGGGALRWIAVGLGSAAVIGGGVLWGGAWAASTDPVLQEEADAGTRNAGIGLGLVGVGAAAIAGGLIFGGE